MPTTPKTSTIRLTLASALLAASAIVPCASAADPVRTAAGCAREFEEAQRVDMESFRDFDEPTWLAGHHPEAITIFASGHAGKASMPSRQRFIPTLSTRPRCGAGSSFIASSMAARQGTSCTTRPTTSPRSGSTSVR